MVVSSRIMAGTLVIALWMSWTATAHKAPCPPPPEWSGASKIGAWHVRRTCSTSADVLRIYTKVGGRLLYLRCDTVRGPYGDIVVMDTKLSRSVTLGVHGNPNRPLEARVNDEGHVVQFGFDDATLIKRFMAALVDGEGPTVTIHLIRRDGHALELVFPRAGLARAAEPLRTRCDW